MVRKLSKKELATKFGEGARKVFTAAASHPTTFAIIVMSVARAAQLLNFEISPKQEGASGVFDRPLENFKNAGGVFRHKAFQGIYNGAQGLGVAAVVAPVAIAGLGLLEAAVSKKAAPAAE